MRRILKPLSAIAVAVCAAAVAAKLPPPSDEAKAKAEEAKAKAAYGDKVAAYKLCKSMDRVAATYYADAKRAGKPTHPPASTPACAEPGPYVAPVAAKPLEASGAHSPAAPAASPPSTKQPDAEQRAAKK